MSKPTAHHSHYSGVRSGCPGAPVRLRDTAWWGWVRIGNTGREEGEGIWAGCAGFQSQTNDPVCLPGGFLRKPTLLVLLSPQLGRKQQTLLYVKYSRATGWPGHFSRATPKGVHGQILGGARVSGSIWVGPQCFLLTEPHRRPFLISCLGNTPDSLWEWGLRSWGKPDPMRLVKPVLHMGSSTGARALTGRASMHSGVSPWGGVPAPGAPGGGCWTLGLKAATVPSPVAGVVLPPGVGWQSRHPFFRFLTGFALC